MSPSKQYFNRSCTAVAYYIESSNTSFLPEKIINFVLNLTETSFQNCNFDHSHILNSKRFCSAQKVKSSKILLELCLCFSYLHTF